MSKIRIGIFGVELNSVNYGCAALAYSQLKMLGEIEKELSCDIEYWIFSDDSKDKVLEVEKYLKLDNVTSKYLVRIKTGIKGIKRLVADIRKCDIIIDLTYGDSFSDIYGLKNFILYSIPKLIAIKEHKKLLLGPQTIGPFYTWLGKKLGQYILKKSTNVFVRDLASKEYVEELLEGCRVILASDLAMELPFINNKSCDVKKSSFEIGLNVSSLLWISENKSTRFDVNISYRTLVRELLSLFEKRGFTTHLITHVYENGGMTEYDIASKLHSEYKSSTILAPKFSNPIEAKEYMSKLDFFIGSRMHATIGAFSAGVPVVPIAYSRKFSGLYNSIGYSYCIDCKDVSINDIIEKVDSNINDIVTMKKEQEEALKIAKMRNRVYKEILKDLVNNINSF